MKNRLRAFIAVRPGIKVLNQIKKLEQKIKPELSGVRWVREEKIHITLKFLGDIKSSDIGNICRVIESSTADLTAFRLYCSNIGVFSDKRRPSVLWTGIGGDFKRFKDIEKRISLSLDKFDLLQGKGDFVPHLTIGRFKKGIIYRDISDTVSKFSSFISDDFVVDEIILFQSKLSRMGVDHIPLFRCKIVHK